MHGKVIKSNDLDLHKQFLERRNFIVANKIPTSNVLFMPTNINEEHIQDKRYAVATYKIIMFGTLEDGQKCAVQINDIYPYIELRVPNNIGPNTFGTNIVERLKNLDDQEFEKATGIKPKFSIKMSVLDDFSISDGKYFKFYEEQNSKWLKISFKKLQCRENAIKYLKESYQVVHNDKDHYYRVACRDYLISFNTWCNLAKCTIERDNPRIKGIVLHVSINDITVLEEAQRTQGNLRNDLTLSMCWDIETYKKYTLEDPGVPLPSNPNHLMFMISTTFQWYWDNSQLLRVCFVFGKINPHPDFVSIECSSEKDMILAFVKVWKWMQPDIILGFNDSGYDWPWLKERSHQLGILMTIIKDLTLILPSSFANDSWDDTKISKYYKSKKIKIEATRQESSSNFAIPGYCCIDVRKIFQKLYPKNPSSSLNSYLELLDLPVKLDITPKNMFDLYQQIIESNYIFNDEMLSMMKKIGHYCIIDSQRCHEMMLKLNIIMDKRAISHMSYVSFMDAIDYADGLKIRNITIARGQKPPFNLKYINVSTGYDTDEKYSGAYVFPPIKGLINGKLSLEERNIESKEARKIIEEYGPVLSKATIDKLRKTNDFPEEVWDFFSEEIKRPITGIDFNSLYPSLIITYNLSSEYMINDINMAARLKDKFTLFPIEYTYGGTIYNSWSIRHNNQDDPSSENFRFGVIPYILRDLFIKRKAVKEKMNACHSSMKLYDEDSKEYKELNFNYQYLNSTQKAMKIFMNTFYGELGCKNSPFFQLDAVTGVTINGARCVKMAHKFVEDKGCRVYYGDTDSIYASMPDNHFLDIDKKYFLGKITKHDYWSEMIEITLRVIKDIRTQINNHFRLDNGTGYLNMAFEEVLFPVIFMGKKKYVGIPHENKPEFHKPLDIQELSDKITKTVRERHPEYTQQELSHAIDSGIIEQRLKRIFIRGLDIIKRGTPNFAKEVILDIIEDIFSMSNTLSVIVVVMNNLKRIYSVNWSDPKLMYKFIITKQYKPNKNNINLNGYVARIQNEYNIQIQPFDYIRYIIAKKYPYSYTESGTRVILKESDKMEPAEIAVEHGHVIDIDSYMKSTVNSLLARLISYYPQFAPKSLEMAAKEIDKYTNDQAKKWINNMSREYIGEFKSLGVVYKTLSKQREKCSKVSKIPDRYIVHEGEEQLFKRIDEETTELVKKSCQADLDMQLNIYKKIFKLKKKVDYYHRSRKYTARWNDYAIEQLHKFYEAQCDSITKYYKMIVNTKEQVLRAKLRVFKTTYGGGDIKDQIPQDLQEQFRNLHNPNVSLAQIKIFNGMLKSSLAERKIESSNKSADEYIDAYEEYYNATILHKSYTMLVDEVRRRKNRLVGDKDSGCLQIDYNSIVNDIIEES